MREVDFVHPGRDDVHHRRHCLQDDDDPNGHDATEFLLFIPKAVLAPVLAIVVVSWWATGYSESNLQQQVSLLNVVPNGSQAGIWMAGGV